MSGSENSPQNTVNYPNLGAINTQATICNSSYNALPASLNRGFADGLQFSTNYTWAHAIDDSPGAFDNYQGSVVNYRDLRAERSSSDLDFRQRFVLSGLYQLPFGKGMKYGSNWNGFENAVLGGWQANLIFTANNGTPFDVFYNGGSPTVRPDLVGNPFAGITTRYQYFNPAAFAPVPKNNAGVQLRGGTTPRNYLVGPHVKNTDLSAFKNFQFGEPYNLQFRAEFYNLTNTPQFINPNNNLTDSNFGKLQSTRIGSPDPVCLAVLVLLIKTHRGNGRQPLFPVFC